MDGEKGKRARGQKWKELDSRLRGNNGRASASTNPWGAVVGCEVKVCQAKDCDKGRVKICALRKCWLERRDMLKARREMAKSETAKGFYTKKLREMGSE